MEENNQVTNLGGNVSNSTFVNTPPVQSQFIQQPVQPQPQEPQVVVNDVETKTVPLTANNVVGVENTRTDYVNVYNQQVSEMIVNNMSSEQPVTVAPEETTVNVQPVTQQTIIPDTVQTTTTVVNPTQNITAGSPTPQQMAQADVVQTTTTGVVENLTQTVQATTIPAEQTVVSSQPVQEQKVEEQPKAEVKQPEQPVIRDNYLLDTEDFVKLVNNAKKAAICENLLIKTMVIQLLFTTEGLKVASTDSANTLIQIDTHIKFTKNLKLCVDAELLTKLVNKIQEPQLEFIYNEENRSVTIKTEKASYILSEIYDNSTFKPIDVNSDGAYIAVTDSIHNIDIKEFKEKINKARAFIGNAAVQSKLNGVYCTDKIYCTNISNIIGINNLPELVEEQFYLSGKYIDLLTQLDFGDTARIGIRKNPETGVAVGVLIDNGSMILSGPVHSNQNEYPLPLLLPVFNKQFAKQIVVNKERLINTLEIGALFIDSNRDKDSCETILSTNGMAVKSINSASTQNVTIENPDIAQFAFNWDIPDTLLALKNCEEENVTIQIDTDESKAFKIVEGEMTEMLNMINI